jgi:hypothetical protein
MWNPTGRKTKSKKEQGMVQVEKSNSEKLIDIAVLPKV